MKKHLLSKESLCLIDKLADQFEKDYGPHKDYGPQYCHYNLLLGVLYGYIDNMETEERKP